MLLDKCIGLGTFGTMIASHITHPSTHVYDLVWEIWAMWGNKCKNPNTYLPDTTAKHSNWRPTIITSQHLPSLIHECASSNTTRHHPITPHKVVCFRAWVRHTTTTAEQYVQLITSYSVTKCFLRWTRLVCPFNCNMPYGVHGYTIEIGAGREQVGRQATGLGSSVLDISKSILTNNVIEFDVVFATRCTVCQVCRHSSKILKRRVQLQHQASVLMT